MQPTPTWANANCFRPSWATCLGHAEWRAPQTIQGANRVTSLAAGVGAKAALGQVMGEALVLAAGSVLVLFNAFLLCCGRVRELFPGPPPPHPDVRRMPAALLIAVNGFLTQVAFAALVGIWVARTPGTS